MTMEAEVTRGQLAAGLMVAGAEPRHGVWLIFVLVLFSAAASHVQDPAWWVQTGGRSSGSPWPPKGSRRCMSPVPAWPWQRGLPQHDPVFLGACPRGLLRTRSPSPPRDSVSTRFPEFYPFLLQLPRVFHSMPLTNMPSHQNQLPSPCSHPGDPLCSNARLPTLFDLPLSFLPHSAPEK